jgi:hypothetical protein
VPPQLNLFWAGGSLIEVDAAHPATDGDDPSGTQLVSRVLIMLIFKNNIYEKRSDHTFPGAPPALPDGALPLDPYEFIKTGLIEEKSVLRIIAGQPKQFWEQDAQNFYPNAWKIGPLPILDDLLQILLQGLENRTLWHRMNTYHFCFLYDIFLRHAYNYNHDSLEEQRKTLPSLQGRPVDIDQFVRDYFFNTVFLLDEDRYNSLSAEEKENKGYTCPCQFGVINGLLPTRDEMELKSTRDYPYSIYV